MCHWCSYHILTYSVIYRYYWMDARQHRIYLFYTIKKKTYNFRFSFLNLSQLLESSPLPTLANKKKKATWHNLLSIQIETISLLCITKNCDWSRKITPLSNLIQMASHGMKTYSESRIELRNVLEKSTQFLSSQQPCGPKSLNVSFNIAEVERIRSENMCLWSTLHAIWFVLRMKGGLPMVEICVLCS